MDSLNVLVVGCGKLGACLAAVFAEWEHFEDEVPLKVFASDMNPTLIESLQMGVVSFPEPDLIPMLNRVEIVWSTDTVKQASQADVAFVVVPTPSGPDGRFDSSMVCAAVRDVCAGFKHRDRLSVPLIGVVSTVMPGACDGEISAVIRDEGFEIGETIRLAYLPAFIALGSVIEDFKNPDLQMVGCADTETFDAVKALYDRVVNPFSTIKHLSIVDTEIAKLSVNVFLSVKVGFANTVARVCEALPGANAERVLDAVGQDSRVNPLFLKAGSTAGGACLPRDVIAFDRVGGDAIAEAVAQADRETLNWVLDTVEDALAAGPDDRPSVCVLGLAYKPSVPLSDYSLGIDVFDSLELTGCYEVTWCDPWDLNPGSTNRVSFEVAKQADVIVLACTHSEFRGLTAKEGQTIVDIWSCCDAGEGTVIRPGVGP